METTRTGDLLAAFAIAVAVAASGCSRAPAHATAVLALDGVPESVATISVFVIDLENDNSIVTSATTTAPKATFALGVPAETPLEFRVVARTNRPGPATIGAMPAYYGSTVRTIALDREMETVALTVHRAGVLTVLLDVDPGILEDDEQIALLLEAETRGVRAEQFTLAPFDPDNPRKQRSLVLRTGRYDAVVTASEGPGTPVIRGGRGLFVAAELESIATLSVVTSSVAPSPGAPASVRLTLAGQTGRGSIATRPDMTTPVTISIAALDAAHTEVVAPPSLVHVEVFADPAETLAARPEVDRVTELPASIPGLALIGSGRVRIRATSFLSDGRAIEGELSVNALVPGVVPSGVEMLALSIADPARLEQGTMLEIDLLDRRGLFAEGETGFVDLSASDPWAFFPDGPGAELTSFDRGRVRRRIARPSGPRGLPVTVRATLTTSMKTLTSTAVLPLLELAP